MITEHEPLAARIPADVDRPDKIISGLTVRQVIILGVTGGLAALIYLAAGDHLPVVVVSAVLLPIVALGAAVALGKRDGLSLDRFALAGLLHAMAPKRLVAAPEGVALPPRWSRVKGHLPAPLSLPINRIRSDGIMELSDGGTAAFVEADTISFGLRTAGEQAALVAAFGRWLNSLDTPVQILVRARPFDLGHLADSIADAAPSLPHPALEQAATEHARYLDELNASRDLLARQVLIVIRDAPAATARRAAVQDASATLVARRGKEAESALAAMGITAHLLNQPEALAVLAECLDPQSWHASPAQPDEIVTGRQPNEAS